MESGGRAISTEYKLSSVALVSGSEIVNAATDASDVLP